MENFVIAGIENRSAALQWHFRRSFRHCSNPPLLALGGITEVAVTPIERALIYCAIEVPDGNMDMQSQCWARVGSRKDKLPELTNVKFGFKRYSQIESSTRQPTRLATKCGNALIDSLFYRPPCEYPEPEERVTNEQTSGTTQAYSLRGNKVFLDANQVLEWVTEFASTGLRTLVMAARLLTPEEWVRLRGNLEEARGRLEGRESALTAAYAAVEARLSVVGCTGVEDKLQDGVPETIMALRLAGIQVWILHHPTYSSMHHSVELFNNIFLLNYWNGFRLEIVPLA
ncbi:unnamed protein product [Protopolystoma xenopodis]|uniref:Uncharacterized protein n=1 Tax=Protopolystoma xenopodis TaxID=117903 RepID=A0A448XEL5_9PLAT|nr:unnamed protein product [Protopolystoma xenopodis]